MQPLTFSHSTEQWNHNLQKIHSELFGFFPIIRLYIFLHKAKQAENLLLPTARVKLLFPSRSKSSDWHHSSLSTWSIQ